MRVGPRQIGPLLLALLALAAATAGPASAQQGFLTSDGPVTLKGTESGWIGANALTAFGGATECFLSSHTGHTVVAAHWETTAEPPSEHELIPSGSTAVTITPHYKQDNCVATDAGGTERPATVDMNGCDYAYYLGERTGEWPEHTYGITADVVCPSGEHIQVTVFAQGSGSHSAFSRVCTITVGPQTGLAGAHVTVDTAAEDLTLAGTFSGLVAAQGGLCGQMETEGAELHVDVTVSGYNSAGQPTGIRITS